MKKQSIEEIGNKLEDLAASVCKIAEGMAAIEETLYHANERTDKDMAKASGQHFIYWTDCWGTLPDSWRTYPTSCKAGRCKHG